MVHSYIINWPTASYVLGYVFLFGIFAVGEAKSKYVHGAIIFLGIQLCTKLYRTNNIFLITCK